MVLHVIQNAFGAKTTDSSAQKPYLKKENRTAGSIPMSITVDLLRGIMLSEKVRSKIAFVRWNDNPSIFAILVTLLTE